MSEVNENVEPEPTLEEWRRRFCELAEAAIDHLPPREDSFTLVERIAGAGRDLAAATARAEAAEREAERLRALANYATHEDSCEFHADLRCSCGYRETADSFYSKEKP